MTECGVLSRADACTLIDLISVKKCYCYILYYNLCNVLVKMYLSLYYRGLFRYVRINNILL